MIINPCHCTNHMVESVTIGDFISEGFHMLFLGRSSVGRAAPILECNRAVKDTRLLIWRHCAYVGSNPTPSAKFTVLYKDIQIHHWSWYHSDTK